MESEVIEFGRQYQEDLVKNVTLLHEVAKRMKRIPELPSEKVTDAHPLLKVEFPGEEGILTYMGGYDHPYRGYPFYEFVDKIDLVKKLSRSLQSGFYHGLKNRWTRYLLIPFIPTLGRSVFWACAYTFHRLIDRFQVRVNRYSPFVSEIYRACSVSWGDEGTQIAELRKMIRDVECMILEMDNAYRFRGQDLLPEMDKEALRKNPVKEINRLLDIWIEREIREEVKDSWRLLKMVVNYYLKYDKKLFQMIVRILLELDLEKCKLTVEDKYFSIPRVDYRFAFMKNPTEADAKLITQVRLMQEHDKKRAEIQKCSTLEHDILNKLHTKEQAKIPATPEAVAKLTAHQNSLKQKLQLIQEQNQKSFEKEMVKVEEEYLTQEQKTMLEKQKTEIRQLDEKFDAELFQAEKDYLEAKAKL